VLARFEFNLFHQAKMMLKKGFIHKELVRTRSQRKVHRGKGKRFQGALLK